MNGVGVSHNLCCREKQAWVARPTTFVNVGASCFCRTMACESGIAADGTRKSHAPALRFDRFLRLTAPINENRDLETTFLLVPAGAWRGQDISEGVGFRQLEAVSRRSRRLWGDQALIAYGRHPRSAGRSGG